MDAPDGAHSAIPSPALPRTAQDSGMVSGHQLIQRARMRHRALLARRLRLINTRCHYAATLRRRDSPPRQGHFIIGWWGAAW